MGVGVAALIQNRLVLALLVYCLYLVRCFCSLLLNLNLLAPPASLGFFHFGLPCVACPSNHVLTRFCLLLRPVSCSPHFPLSHSLNLSFAHFIPRSAHSTPPQHTPWAHAAFSRLSLSLSVSLSLSLSLSLADVFCCFHFACLVRLGDG